MSLALLPLLLLGTPASGPETVALRTERVPAPSSPSPRASAFPVPPAPPAQWGGFYAGLAGGVSDSLADGDDLDDDLNVPFNTNTDLDSNFFGWKLYGGYRFPDTPWSVELAYVDLGELESEIVAAPPNLNAFQNQVEDEHPHSGRGLALCGRYSFEFAERFAVSAKAGGWWWSSTAEFTTIQPPGGTRTTEEVDETDIDVVAGLGFDARISGGFHGRLELERYFLDGEDTHLFSLGVFYVFQ